MIALSEIRELPLHDKLRMMEALWDGIAPLEDELDVPDWHKEILDQRDRMVAEGKATFIDWDVAKQQIRDSVS